jgi:hypothetical protein
MKLKLTQEDIDLLNENDTYELEDGTWEFASQFCGVHVYKTATELREWLIACRKSKQYKIEKEKQREKENIKKEKILKGFVTETDEGFIISKSKLKELKELGCQNVGILYEIGKVINK